MRKDQKRPKKVAVYVRVSTNDQSVDMQIKELMEYVDKRKLELYDIYRDEGISGTKKSRPALDRMMAEARKRRFDIVLVWKFDRFGRSVIHLVNSLEEFEHLGIDFISFTQSLDTSGPMGKLIFNIFASIGQMERDNIVERTVAGMKAAKARGVHIGRKPTPEYIKDKVRKLREKENLSGPVIAEKLDLSRTTVWRILNDTPA